MLWMPLIIQNITDNIDPSFKYVGVDIVPSVIEDVKKRFADKPWEFRTGDITKDIISEKFDMIMARDVFFHLPYGSIHCALNHISNSGAKWLLTTTSPGVRNSPHSMYWRPLPGGFRPLDLQASPFNLPPFVEKIPEINRIMAVFKLPLPNTYTRPDGGPLDCSMIASRLEKKIS